MSWDFKNSIDFMILLNGLQIIILCKAFTHTWQGKLVWFEAVDSINKFAWKFCKI
jgi:hypothetical protein